MIEIRPSRPEEIARQKELWKQAFHDEDAYIDFFYDHAVKPEDVMVLLEDARVLSMLVLLPVTLALPDGSAASSSYIYALATDSAQRKRGFGRQLLKYTDFYLRDRGLDCVTVVPAEVSLHKFFSTVGFSECFATRKAELLRGMVSAPAPEDRAEEAGAAEYLRIREARLADTFHVVYGEELIACQQGVSRMERGGLLRLEVDGEEGVAAAEYFNKDSVLVKELVISPERMERAAALIAAQMPAVRYHIRTPALWQGLPGSYIQAFGMVKWFDREKERLWQSDKKAYLGLGFD